MLSQLTGDAAAPVLPAGRGRGPGGQWPGTCAPASRCPITGCDAWIDPSRLMCRWHWYRVPKRLRDRVWATWRSGAGAHSTGHREAVLAAITSAGNTLREPERNIADAGAAYRAWQGRFPERP